MSFDTIWQHITESYQQLYNPLGFFCVKDLSGHFCHFNEYLMEYAGYSSPHEMLGKTDFDTPWADQAANIRKNDRLVISTRRGYLFYESIQNQSGEFRLYVSNKKPLYRNNVLTGVLSLSIEAPAESIVGALHFSDKMKFVDIRRHTELILTTRQKETIYWMLCGHSTKEIAQLMKLSSRTIEHYINSIKEANNYSCIRDMLLHVRAV